MAGDEGLGVHEVEFHTGAAVMLERQEDGHPEYEVFGLVDCVACGKTCWLGANTFQVVMAGEAMPVCTYCGAVVTRPENYMGNVGP